jgi:anti-sigma B factor antagonist
MQLHLEIEHHPACVLLILRGELELSTAAQLREAFVQVGQANRHIIVDLQRVQFIDSAGLGILVGGLKRARSSGGDLELICTSPDLLRTLKMTGLDKIFTIHDHRETAAAPTSP